MRRGVVDSPGPDDRWAGRETDPFVVATRVSKKVITRNAFLVRGCLPKNAPRKIVYAQKNKKKYDYGSGGFVQVGNNKNRVC
jgi:hypothetical protein